MPTRRKITQGIITFAQPKILIIKHLLATGSIVGPDFKFKGDSMGLRIEEIERLRKEFVGKEVKLKGKVENITDDGKLKISFRTGDDLGIEYREYLPRIVEIV